MEMKEILAVLVAAVLLAGCAGNSAAPQATNPGSSAGAAAQNSGTLFAGSQYAKTAVEAYPGSTTGPSSGEVQGFDMATTPQADGSIKITMTEKAGGQTLTATVPAGGSLYFNDANPGDDTAGTDKFLQDDKLIVVDANGYVVPG